jgi:hypothetical protein
MILAFVGLVGHLIALRVFSGTAEPWGNLPWALQVILLLCCLSVLWGAWTGNQLAFWMICISAVAGIIMMFIAVAQRPVPTILVMFSVGMKALVLRLLLSREARSFLAYQRRRNSSDAAAAG